MITKPQFDCFCFDRYGINNRSQGDDMTTETWNGGSGNWNDPTKWTPQSVPQASDTAVLLGGTVDVSNVDASNILIWDSWNLAAFQQGDVSALDQDATLDISNSVIGDVDLVGGNPVTPHGTAFAHFNINGGVIFRGTFGVVDGGEGDNLAINMSPGSALVNQGQWYRYGEGIENTTIDMSPGSALVNQATINGTDLTIAGNGPGEAIVNNGTIAISNDLVLGPLVAGTGTIELTGPAFFLYPTAANAEFQGFVAPQQTFAFEKQPEGSYLQNLTIDVAREFLGTIAGFGQGDDVVLKSLTATSEQYKNGVLTLYNGKASVAALHFSGSHSQTDFTLASSNNTTTIAHS
jgi:hypothetical protein